MAGRLSLHPVPGLWRRRGDRLPVPLVLGTTVTRRPPSRTGEAFWTLQLVTEHAPEPARVAFRSELGALGLRGPGDPDAPAAAILADVRPDLFARAAGTVVLPWLDGAERALAAAAVNVLTATTTSRRARSRAGRRSPAMTEKDDRLAQLAALEELAELEQRAAAVREHAYGQAQAQLIHMETRLQGIIRDPGPTVRRGAVVPDGDGQPVPNEAVRRQAQKTLDRVRRDWARLTGEA